MSDDVFPNDYASYVSALYVTTKITDAGDITFTYYNSTDCENVFPDPDDVRLTYLYGYSCPDVPNIDDFFMPIQGSSSFLGLSDQFGYNF
jgi:hypothetical protein